MKKYYDLLAQTRLFQGIEEQEIGAMLECLQFSCEKFEKGETVYRMEEQIQEQKERQKEPTRLSDEAKKVFLVLSDRPREAEEIMQLVSVAPNGIFSALTELELAGLIFKRGSGYYKKCIW